MGSFNQAGASDTLKRPIGRHTMYTSQLQSQLSVVLFRILSRGIISGLAGVQFNRHLKFKAWVKDGTG